MALWQGRSGIQGGGLVGIHHREPQRLRWMPRIRADGWSTRSAVHNHNRGVRSIPPNLIMPPAGQATARASFRPFDSFPAVAQKRSKPVRWAIRGLVRRPSGTADYFPTGVEPSVSALGAPPPHLPRDVREFGCVGGRHEGACRARARSSSQQQEVVLAAVPGDYTQAVRQAQAAIKAAVADGVGLLEVRFCKPFGLDAGCNIKAQ